MGVSVKTFFICALPRSRTAWLSVFLTHGDSFCFHEPAVGLGDFSEFRRLFESTGRPIVGSADCGNVWIADGLNREFPGSRFITIHRPIDECRKSMLEMGLPDNGTLEKSLELLHYTDSTYSHISFDAKDLGDPEAVKMLCDCVGAPFDRHRFDMLSTLDIQVRPSYIASRMTAANVSAMSQLMEAR